MKALTLLKSSQNVEKRAEKYVNTITRNLQKEFLDPIQDLIEKKEDKIQSLLDFSLDTDLNKGVAPVSREIAQSRFSQVLVLEYELELLKKELEIKQVKFNEYFEDEA